MVGTWLAGQRPGPAEPDAGTARPCDIRVEGRSVSGLRPDSLLRCSALGGLLTQPHNFLCQLMVKKLACAGQQHGLLSRALGRQQTSMPSGSGLLPVVPSCALLALGGTTK